MSKHIVLVHGACHGAWCWYKLKPLLEAAGHRVTALDLAASGIDRRSLRELRTLADYSQPLLEMMAAIPAEEKVVVVGHSLGGMNISLAMEMYPHKISVAIFLAAFMPDHTHPPSYVLDQDLELAKMLIRPSSLFLEDLSKRKPFTKQGYGSVKRVYAVCTEDKGIPVNFQRWQIETNGVDEVKVLENIDHMAMLSKPQDVCHCILEIANIYA
ncbi:salicylic acid-binding protein 2-like isoform X2 [Salvia miltiorrhiza]|uniref:salicylic acid-binding protein 2-like isoform X2 n=1 Tax=Salvia miltiorrhiza TaxID=226208 RepID=UPI0025AC1F8C|nr:salicylic acid-binding protein 2-like isoform X2 [Salvia miltiorrhiza]